MSSRIRLPLAVGGLGAVVLLGLAANLAIGGSADRTDQVRSALHGGKAKPSSSSSATAWATRRSRSPRYYQYGAAGLPGLDALPLTGFQYHLVAPGRPGRTSPTTSPTRRPPGRVGDR